MKLAITSYCLLNCVLFWIALAGILSCTPRSEKPLNQLVNPVIGDASFHSVYGVKPDELTNELVRVRTHLKFAEELLRGKDVSHLSERERSMRAHLLDILQEYWKRGVFPVNTKYADERRPCFIDDAGTMCAVGYLVEQTAGLNLAKAISASYQYAYISEMDMSELDLWIAQSGLTAIEVATIQPTYDWYTFRVQTYTLSGGMSTRGMAAGYPRVDFAYSNHRGNYRSIAALQYESLGPKDFSAGLHLGAERAIPFFPGKWKPTCGVGFMPSFFTDNAELGSNLKPDISFGFPLVQIWRFGLQLTFSYGYDFPVMNRDAFPVSRHDLSARMALSYKRTKWG